VSVALALAASAAAAFADRRSRRSVPATADA